MREAITFDEWFADFRARYGFAPVSLFYAWKAGFTEAMRRVENFETETYEEGWQELEKGARRAAKAILADFETNG